MKKDLSYISMTQAIKKYWKSRQTFYNYIKKWVIATKKIHHKSYLSVRDIERTLWWYVWEKPQLDALDSQSNGKEWNKQQQPSDLWFDIHSVSLKENPDFYELSTTLQTLQAKINLLPNDFALYTKQMNTENKHYIDTLYSKLQGYIKNVEDYITSLSQKHKLAYKKQRFALWFLLFTLVNIGIVLFLMTF